MAAARRCVAVVLDRKLDKSADTGKFELAFKQPQVSVPPYIGINLTVDGAQIKKPTWMTPKKSLDIAPVTSRLTSMTTRTGNVTATTTQSMDESTSDVTRRDGGDGVKYVSKSVKLSTVSSSRNVSILKEKLLPYKLSKKPPKRRGSRRGKAKKFAPNSTSDERDTDTSSDELDDVMVDGDGKKKGAPSSAPLPPPPHPLSVPDPNAPKSGKTDSALTSLPSDKFSLTPSSSRTSVTRGLQARVKITGHSMAVELVPQSDPRAASCTAGNVNNLNSARQNVVSATPAMSSGSLAEKRGAADVTIETYSLTPKPPSGNSNILLPQLDTLPAPAVSTSLDNVVANVPSNRYKHNRPVMKIKTPSIDLDARYSHEVSWAKQFEQAPLAPPPPRGRFGVGLRSHKIPYINASLAYKMANVPKLKYMNASSLNAITRMRHVNPEIERIHKIMAAHANIQ